MSTGTHDRRRRQVPEEHVDERWLLTYSDMITLLMSLFLVLWAISSVNISKFDQLKVSLHSAFSGKVLPAPAAVLTGGRAVLSDSGAPITPPLQSSQPAFKMTSIKASVQAAARRQDNDNLRRIQRQVDRYARQHGLSARLKTTIDERGLVIHVLTDAVLFDSGQAALKHPATLLGELAHLITRTGIVNPVRIEGYTDNIPVSSSQFRSNWELSSARANAVLEFMLGHGVAARRLSTAGYGDQHPIASNASATGRSRNRRVSVVLLRRTFN
ncbi:MAG TPA: flagellar motor protein MotB [Gaiellales bacterium]|jgi:chemotaxis protein MotB|nr:flagellar motor protein MotB [Gaiellales bacterium]